MNSYVMLVPVAILIDFFERWRKSNRPLPRKRLEVGQKTAVDFVSLIISRPYFTCNLGNKLDDVGIVRVFVF